MLNPERKGWFVRKLRMLAGVLTLALAVGTAGRAEIGNRAWWGVMYKDALLLAKADEEIPKDETEVVFVWPLWESLLRFFGLQ